MTTPGRRLQALTLNLVTSCRENQAAVSSGGPEVQISNFNVIEHKQCPEHPESREPRLLAVCDHHRGIPVTL
jgi:hypothetical protein